MKELNSEEGGRSGRRIGFFSMVLVLGNVLLCPGSAWPQGNGRNSRRAVDVAIPLGVNDRVGVNDRAYEPWPEDGCEVYVVHGRSELPVPNAVIWYVEHRVLPRTERSRYEGAWPRASSTARQERWFRADDQGRVVLPNVLGTVVGSSQGLWGRGMAIPWDKSPRTLELYPDTSLAVRVLDMQGNPVLGLPVELILANQSHEERALARTGKENGLAWFQHVPYWASFLGDRRTAVGLAIPLDPPVEMEIDPEALPTVPVDLVVPPLGELEIRLVDEQGASIRSPARVEVWPVPKEQKHDSRSTPRPTLHQSRTRYLQVGEGCLREPVGLGLTLEVLVSAHGGFADARTRVRGPMRAGEVVPCLIRLVEDEPSLTGRFVDEDGRPLADTSFHLFLVDRFGESATSLAGEQLHTDGEGYFHKEIRFLESPEDVVRMKFRSESGRERAPVDATVIVGEPLKLGENDLGVLSTAIVPLLVAGTVVDEAGTPLGGVTLYAAERRAPERRALEWNFPERPAANFGVGCVTDPDGSFRIHSRTEADSIRVTTRSNQDLRTEHEIRDLSSGRDVVLVLGPGGSIVGSICADEHVPSHMYRAEVVAEDADPRIVYPMRVQSNGQFAVNGLPSGRYRLGVFHPIFEEALVTVRGIEVRVGETTDTLALQDIDLSNFLEKIELTVLDEGGRRLEHAQALYRTPGEAYRSALPAKLVRGGNLALVTGGNVVDVLVFAPGHRTQLVEGISHSSHVTLKKGIPVRFQFECTAGWTAEELQAKVRLRSLDHHNFQDHRHAVFDELGEVLVHVPSAGAYDVLLPHDRPWKRQEMVFFCGTGRQWKYPSIEVLDLAEEQVFHILLTPGENGDEVRVLPLAR